MSYKEIKICPISGKDDKITYLNLGDMPLVNNLNSTREESLKCDRYPLKLNYYEKSKLSALSIAIDPTVLFNYYVYKSGTSEPYIHHCKSMYSYISTLVNLKDGDKILDIGGNDGTLLESFVSQTLLKLSTINVDPSENLGKISRKKGIKTKIAMWSYELSKKIKNCKIITSTNVFQHTQDIEDFAKGVVNSLHKDGIWCLEFPYWKHDLETYQYDQIYHEHIYYYLFTSIYNLFKKVGLEIIDVSEHSIHGGTLRVISRKNRNSPSNDNVLHYFHTVETNFKHIQYYRDWGKRAKAHMGISKEYIEKIKKSGKRIACFGAAAKGCIFLNCCGLDYKAIDYIVDDTDLKQGKFMPGTGIEIVSRDVLIKNPPDYILILAHNFTDYIIKSLKPIYNGKFLVMFPNIICYE